MSDTPETEAEAMDVVCWHGDPSHKMEYEKSKSGDIVPAQFARRLEHERDEARRERDEARRDRDDSMEELALMQKKLASLIRRWKGRKKEYLNAVTLALEKGDKSASCRYHGESIGTHWAIEDLELILKRKEEAK